ncbi:MAG: DEAD/DEAH box helicase, partial [Thermoanaerobaculia bacterium]|nr:DEAD/DEAH box helicase [Thermoanaerobaculia bacterium]
ELRFGGGQMRAKLLRQLLELRPTVPFRQPKGLLSQLRPYQRMGVDWLRFLYENGLGGLLCDDMGLGKTHQAMALMVWLREIEKLSGPFLVVAPTSVLSHWRDKIRDFAPALSAIIHHGTERNLEAALEAADVVVTSYGLLRRDLEKLAGVRFALAIFDEIQNMKNRGTLAWQAAHQLEAGVKLGLTGTPIENSLGELKALFDLVLPGYLGGDEAFLARYAAAEEDPKKSAGRLGELRRSIGPFVLRRLKTAVLDELPEKFEDVRMCALSEDQVGLYREAISDRGGELMQALNNTAEPLPYIHVFALLNLLKQICDHPALALGKLEEAERWSSGKWDLFVELLGECLGSGQKVVVFSQYLGMIRLMERHLEKLGVGFVKLTGASQDRGAIVDRFNKSEECRVFLGSLKAGGTGIDLVGGSVVIHYDRWWNAAREDQASDRVHRIGQKRAVQIFKLVTEGTLEEKISAIIDKKRALMDSVVQEDDPKLSKVFSRDELLALLTPV